MLTHEGSSSNATRVRSTAPAFDAPAIKGRAEDLTSVTFLEAWRRRNVQVDHPHLARAPLLLGVRRLGLRLLHLLRRLGCALLDGEGELDVVGVDANAIVRSRSRRLRRRP